MGSNFVGYFRELTTYFAGVNGIRIICVVFSNELMFTDLPATSYG